MSFALAAAFAATCVHGNSSARSRPPRSDPNATLSYIHAAWDTLTRSVTDCNSLADIKVDSAPLAEPVLYLPADLPAPPEVTALEQNCHVQSRSGCRAALKSSATCVPEELHTPGLLYLPNPYVVPGGRFNEMYGWDSYFILLGLEADHSEALAKGIVDNFLFEIEHYGAVLNANRTYYLTRSQPPFLTSMIRAVYENPASFPATPAGRMQARAWLEHAYALAEKDHSTWDAARAQSGFNRPGPLFRLWNRPGARDGRRQHLLHRCDSLAGGASAPGRRQLIWLKAPNILTRPKRHGSSQTSCDVHASVVCARAWFGGYRLSRDFYVGDRAMRESGFDTSNRFGPFSGDTQHYAPVCLNSLLYRYERDLEHLALLLGNAKDAAHWDRRSQAARRSHPALSLAAERWRLCRLRLCPRADIELCLHHFALSVVGWLRHARTGDKDGSAAQPL